jgi:hypothetical protein
VRRRRLLAAIALAATAGTVAWALSGLPGASAPCPAAGCDCEAGGAGPIHQPANAWSSLALAAAGIALLWASPARAGELRGTRDESSGRLPGAPHPAAVLLEVVPAVAAILAGVAAFLFHAALTAWGARLDGIAAGVLIAALALDLWRERRQRFLLPALPAALGALCWALGRSGGPWCRPGSLFQAHAAWHLLAACAVFLWLRDGRPGRRASPIPPRPLPSRREDCRP